MNPGLITDEFSPNFEEALDECTRVGIQDVELRKVGGLPVTELDLPTVRRLGTEVRTRGLRVCALAAPLLKCPPPANATTADARSFLAQLDSAHARAEALGTRLVRVFSFLIPKRPVPDLKTLRDEILSRIAEASRRRGFVAVLENEHTCTLGTAGDVLAVLDRIDSPGIAALWDPGNGWRRGEAPDAESVERLGSRIAHVHVKNIDERGSWCSLQGGLIDFEDVLGRLRSTGYRGVLSLETHYESQSGCRREATRECARQLLGWLARAEA